MVRAAVRSAVLGSGSDPSMVSGSNRGFAIALLNSAIVNLGGASPITLILSLGRLGLIYSLI